jgi:hypothetical protein
VRNPVLIDLATNLFPVLESRFGRPIEKQIRAWQAYHGRNAPAMPRRLYRGYVDIPGG